MAVEQIASWIGWLATIAIVVAMLVPIGVRVRTGKRGATGSRPIRVHVIIGLATASMAFLHTMLVLPALGSPAATGGGMAALLPAGAAFFLLVAHAGLGFQLRDPKLRDRVRKRRMHGATAVLISLAVAMHIIVLERAGR